MDFSWLPQKEGIFVPQGRDPVQISGLLALGTLSDPSLSSALRGTFNNVIYICIYVHNDVLYSILRCNTYHINRLLPRSSRFLEWIILP